MAQNKSGIHSHRHSKGFALCLALLCLGLGFVRAVHAQSSDTGSQIRVVDLDLNPAPDVLVAARQAYRQGAVIRILGGSPQDLQRLLGVGAFSVLEGTTDSESAPSSLSAQNSQPQQVVAVHIGNNGALHQFVHFNNSLEPDSWQSAFQTWMDGEVTESSNALSSLQAPPPDGAAWTALQQITSSGSDGNNNAFKNTVSIYRLNDISSGGDWYMVLTEPTSQPDFKAKTCTLQLTACGWWTSRRTISITTNPVGTLFDHGPTSTITTKTAAFSIGGSLGFANPQVSATYSTSWSQPDVTTIDRSDILSQKAQWQENFTGAGYINGPPPNTSISTFFSNQAAIFEFPEGTSSFSLQVTSDVTSEYYSTTFLGNGFHFGTIYNVISGTIVPPLFAVDPLSLTIPANSSAVVQLTARIPGSSIGLPWTVTNAPTWLTVGQTSGSGPAGIRLTVLPNTPTGSVASLNFTTDPKYAAPSVERNPLIVNVKVGQPEGTGLLVVGGVNGNSGNPLPLSTAEFVQPQVTAASPMQGPRMGHTATLLQNGQLLVAGGSSQPYGDALATAETFDPQSGFFSSTSGSMTTSRIGHTATLLNNGKVLITGGLAQFGDSTALATTELYDPSTRTFTPAANMTAPRAYHTATLLSNGDVLIAGGLSGLRGVNTAEIYHTATGTFSPTAGPMVAARAYHTSTLLSSGEVLLAGGIDATGGSGLRRNSIALPLARFPLPAVLIRLEPSILPRA